MPRKENYKELVQEYVEIIIHYTESIREKVQKSKRSKLLFM